MACSPASVELDQACPNHMETYISEKSKLVTDNLRIWLTPIIITDSPPDTIVVDFNTTFHWGGSTHQPDCNISVVCEEGEGGRVCMCVHVGRGMGEGESVCVCVEEFRATSRTQPVRCRIILGWAWASTRLRKIVANFTTKMSTCHYTDTCRWPHQWSYSSSWKIYMYYY